MITVILKLETRGFTRLLISLFIPAKSEKILITIKNNVSRHLLIHLFFIIQLPNINVTNLREQAKQ